MVNYKLVRSRRKTIAIEIRDDEVIVRAPLDSSSFFIENFVRRYADWIRRRMARHVKKFRRKFAPEEEFLFLGKSYRLTIVLLDREKVICKNGNFEVHAITDRKEDLRRILRKFYQTKTKEIVEKQIKCHKDFFGEAEPNIKYKFYKSKWGSCSPKNELTFNSKLSMMPEEIIGYIVIHELSHTRHKNHSKHFWLEVKKHDCEYKIHRKWVRDNSDRMVL